MPQRAHLRRILVVVLLTGALAAGATGCSGRSGPEADERSVVVAIALPQAGRDKPRAEAMATAVHRALQARAGKAGSFRVVLREVDSFDAGLGSESEDSCRVLGSKLARDGRVVAVVGPAQAICLRTLVPRLNRAGVSVVASVPYHPGLNHVLPASVKGRCFECSPAAFYPTRFRNLVRVIPTVDANGAAAADLLQRLHKRRVFILRLGDSYDTPWVEAGFLAEALKLRLRVVGRALYLSRARTFAPYARSVIRSRADALLFLAPWYAGGVKMLKAVRAAGFRGAVVTTLDGFADQSFLTDAPGAVEGAYFTSVMLPPAALPPAGRSFVAALGTSAFTSEALFAAEAANVVFDAIAASDGTRVGVRRALFRLTRTGLVGRLSFDANGDVHPRRVAVFQAKRGQYVYGRLITLR